MWSLVILVAPKVFVLLFIICSTVTMILIIIVFLVVFIVIVTVSNFVSVFIVSFFVITATVSVFFIVISHQLHDGLHDASDDHRLQTNCRQTYILVELMIFDTSLCRLLRHRIHLRQSSPKNEPVHCCRAHDVYY